MSSSVICSIIALELRFYLAFILLLSGFNQFMSGGAMIDNMKNLGMPSIFLYFFICLETVSSFLISTGYQTRLCSIILVLFMVVTGFFFHNNFSEKDQVFHFMKHLVFAGGFLFLYLKGPGIWSVDYYRKN